MDTREVLASSDEIMPRREGSVTQNEADDAEDDSSVRNVDPVTTTPITMDDQTDNNNIESVQRRGCCDWTNFRGVVKAKGFANAATGNASILVSNVFLAASIAFLASQEAGCVDEETQSIIPDCPNRVHGFLPQTLVPTIYAFASLGAAFFMPLVGAVIDYTDQRKRVGQSVAVFLFLIQATQIGTVSRTWFPMAILQALTGVLFQFHFLFCVSYLPDIIRYHVDYTTMAVFNRTFYGLQYGGQILFLIIVVIVSRALDFGDVATAQVGQTVSALCLAVCYPLAWRYFPKVEGRHKLPDTMLTKIAKVEQGTNDDVDAIGGGGGDRGAYGSSVPSSNCGSNTILRLFRAGINQNYKTFKVIAKDRKPLKWFLFTIILAEAGNSSLVPVMITIMTQVVGFQSSTIGIMFLVCLLSALPGLAMGTFLCKRYNPSLSVKIDLILVAIVTLTSGIFMSKERIDISVVWAILWGFTLGWYYSTQQLYFAASMPPNQETELSGLYVYCTIVLAWLPPVIVAAMLEAGVPPKWGTLPLVAFQCSALFCACMCPSWEIIVQSATVPLVVLDGTVVTQEMGVLVGEGDVESSTNPELRTEESAATVDGTIDSVAG